MRKNIINEEYEETDLENYNRSNRKNLFWYQLMPDSYGQPNIFDMINKGRVEVYIFIFSGYMELENTQELKW